MLLKKLALFTGIISWLSLTYPITVLGETDKSFSVLCEQIRTELTTSGGGRERCTPPSPKVPLILLAPDRTVGKTILDRPTFIWYVTEKVEKQLLFTLAEANGRVAIFEKELIFSTPGLVSFTLPENVQLSTGKTYQWTISVLVDKKDRTLNLSNRGWIQKITAVPELNQKLASVSSDYQRSLILDEYGLWYDSVAALHKSQQAASSSFKLKEK
jgi:Domain of Unknown Function (DUF928)